MDYAGINGGCMEGSKLNKKTRFCLIGADNLLISCADFLKRQNYTLSAIFSDHVLVQEWACSHQCEIYPLSDIDGISDIVEEFDYLLSIYNPKLLTTTVLTQAKKLAVNYHNALLPKYRGSNATAWSILNGEKKHGITWHIIQAGLDKGPVLFQGSLDILPDDTALTLNIRCNELAKHTFPDFINQLLHKKLIPQPQSQLETKTYRLLDQPTNRGFLNWQQPAEVIYATFRALSFGSQSNTMGTPKVCYNGQPFIVERMEITDENATSKQPGSIISIDVDSVSVATSTKVIRIKALRYFNGKLLSIEDFPKIFAVKPNDSFYSINALLNHVQQIITCSQSESFWVSQWARVSTVTILSRSTYEHVYRNNLLKETPTAFKKVINLKSNGCFATLLDDTLLSFISLVSVYLYKHNQYRPVSFLLDYTLLQRYFNQSSNRSSTPYSPCFLCSALHSIYVPFSISFSPDDKWETVKEKVFSHMALLYKKGPYLQDVFYRYPEIGSYYTSTIIRVSNIDRLEQSTTSSQLYKNPIIEFFISYKDNYLAITSDIDKEFCGDNYATLVANHLKSLWSTLCQHTQQSLKQTILLSESDKKILLTQWSNFAQNYEYKDSLISLFDREVEKNPGKIALIDELGNTITYKKLQNQSEKLAFYLLSKGISHQSGVCFIMENEIETILSIISILRCGAYYIPIPLSYPNKLIQHIIEGNRPKVLLVSQDTIKYRLIEIVNSRFSNYIPDILNVNKITYPEIRRKIWKNASLNDNAYIMYTSGSTGQPKGVVITQKAIIRLVKQSNFICIEAQDQIAQSSSIAFDPATFLIWGALLNGATLHLIKANTLINANRFSHILLSRKISILCLTSRLFDCFSDFMPSMFKFLRVLLVGGDVLDRAHIERMLQYLKNKNCEIFNVYGPTENTTFTTTYHIDKSKKYPYDIPIGKPVTNTSVYVLDCYLNPQPIGMAGYLYIGGQGLSTGYLNEELLNKKVFIAGNKTAFPFDPGKLYCSRDRVFWLSDGNLSYLGRQDTQIKIRGYRVDFSIISAVLFSCPCVKLAYVTFYQHKYSKQICAFVTLSDHYINKHIESLSAIKQQLIQELPEFMYPNNIVIVDHMPLNANGKINRNALLSQNIAPSNTPYFIAKNPIEKKLIEIWSDILGHNQFHRDDKFMEVGGNSLGVATMLFKLQKQYTIDISMTELLQHDSIQSLSNYITQKTSGGEDLIRQLQTKEFDLLRNDIKENNMSGISIDKLPKSKHDNVLLTGATGYLGRHLLLYLLKNTKSTIYCLVRCAKETNSFQLLQRLFPENLNCSHFSHRVKIVTGDLEKENLGISPEQYNFLERSISVIYHVGAYVNHLYDYPALRLANVFSTQALITFSATYCRKKLIYVSTLSAVSLNDCDCIDESFYDDWNYLQDIPDGYSRTKWASEYLLHRALEKGYNIHIVRSGWILGSQEGLEFLPKNNHLLSLIQSCIELGVAPNWNAELRILPADFVATVITLVGLKGNQSIYNVINIKSILWKELIEYLRQVTSSKIRFIPVKEWVTNYLSNLPRGNALEPFLPLYLSARFRRSERPDITVPVIQNNTISLLDANGFLYQQVNAPFMQSFFKQLSLYFHDRVKGKVIM